MFHKLGQTIRSAYLDGGLRLSEFLRWSRGPFREAPCGELAALSTAAAMAIQSLQNRYGEQFERRYSRVTSLNNYEYLGFLDALFRQAQMPIPTEPAVCDAGSASFWYAAALQVFFRPKSLVGIEVEGFRLMRNLYSRADYAAGYSADWPNTRFIVGNYTSYSGPADVVTCWFPFLTPEPVLAWRLPLRLLDPQAWFASVRRNLAAGGLLVMANHGLAEADKAAFYCEAKGLRSIARMVAPMVVRQRSQPAVLSLWSAQPAACDTSLRLSIT
jgi:hypothetical protein